MPRPNPQKPTRVILEGPGFSDGMIEKSHPAYGMALFCRVNGGDPNLFGSDVKHDQRISLVVSKAKEQWQLSRRWHHGDSKALIEIEMSESQFVSLVSTFNVGSGVPVTIKRTETDWNIPAIEDDADSLIDMIKADIEGDVKTVVEQAAKIVSELKAVLETSGIPQKRQKALLALAEKLHQNLTANMPYVLKQYQEGVDSMQAQARAEIDAFAVHAAARLGVRSLQQLAAAVNDEVAKPLIEWTPGMAYIQAQAVSVWISEERAWMWGTIVYVDHDKQLYKIQLSRKGEMVPVSFEAARTVVRPRATPSPV